MYFINLNNSRILEKVKLGSFAPFKNGLIPRKKPTAEECYREISKRMHHHYKHSDLNQAVVIELGQATMTIRKGLDLIPPKNRYLALIPQGSCRYAWIAFNPGYKEYCALTSSHLLDKALTSGDARFLLRCGKWVLLHENN